MNINSFVQPKVLISDIAKLCGDPEFRDFSAGFYMGQIQSCLNELAFDTFFQEGNMDVDIPTDSLCIPMPENIFNIREMFVFNGDECTISNVNTVYHKRNYIAKKTGYTARVKNDNSNDPYQFIGGGNDSAYFYEIQNGLIMISASCQVFEKLRIYYNGVGGKIEDSPIVPLFFRQAVIDWVALRGLEMKIMKNPGANSFLYAMRDRVEKRLMDPYDGSWIKAQRRVKQIDTKEKQDLNLYYGRLNY